MRIDHITRDLMAALRNHPEREFLVLESQAWRESRAGAAARPAGAATASPIPLAPERTWPDRGEGWRHGFAWRSDAHGGHEVLMAGRHYLLDPLPSRLNAAPRGTVHVVLLGLSHLHLHLSDFCEALNQRESVILYCPLMYWELLYAKDPNRFRRWSMRAPDMFRDPPNQGIGAHTVIGFETWADIGAHSEEPDRPAGYFEGLRLHLSFAVSPGLPSLQAAFCCNGRKLLVQKEGSWGIADAMILGSAQDAIAAYAGCVDLPVLEADPAQQQRLNARMAEIQCWRGSALPRGTGDVLRLGSSGISRAGAATTWSDVRGWPWEPPCAIARTAEPPIGLPLEHPVACAQGDLGPLSIDDHAGEGGAEDSNPCRWVVGIACGRPAAMLSRRPELVGPLLPITVPAGSAAPELRVMSLIQWQLEGIALLAEKMGLERMDVVLLTTPLLEDGIRHEIERLARQGSAAGEGIASPRHAPEEGYAVRLPQASSKVNLRVRVAPQHLLWRFKPGPATAGIPQPGHSSSLYYNGHFDMLRVLVEINARLSPELMWNHALAMSHNNLGVFGDPPQVRISDSEIERTRRRMAAFAASDHDAAVEAFELECGAGRRWRELSYFAREQLPAGTEATTTSPRPTLVKQVWYPTGQSEGHTAYFSSNTWYFNLGRLVALRTLEFRRLSFSPAGEPIDMLSWPSALGGNAPLSIGLFRHDLAGAPLAGKNEFHRHRRFAVLLEDSQFAGLPPFERLKLQDPGSTNEGPEAGKTPQLLSVSPAIKKNIWGGHQISQRKGWEPEWIGETWEISTHPAGPATYVGTDLRKHTLQEALGHLRYMGKFLDCELPLSVQIHPTLAAMRHLAGQATGGRAHGDTELSKEESFYIIAAAHRSDGEGPRTHVISGFNRARLSAFADALLPVMACLDGGSAPDEGRFDLQVRALWTEVATRFLEPLLARLCREREARSVDVEAVLRQLKQTFLQDHALKCALDFHASRMHRVELPLYAAGAGILCAIRCLGQGGGCLPPELKSALYRHCEAAQSAVHFDKSELFSVFNAVQVSPGDWLRVPAGTPHAFQGGGNLIIEISNRSDATYRILDFGREFSDFPRPMHLAESMLCLSQHAFQDAGTIDRYRQSAVSGYGVCHKDLQWRLHDKHAGATAAAEAQGPGRTAFETKSLSFLFNLGDSLRIDTQAESCSLPAFSAAVATPGVMLALNLSDESRLLELRERLDGREAVLALMPLARPKDQPHGCEAAMLIEGDEGIDEGDSKQGPQDVVGPADGPHFDLQHGYRVLKDRQSLPEPDTAWTHFAAKLSGTARPVRRCLALPGHAQYQVGSGTQCDPQVAEVRRASHANDAFDGAIAGLRSQSCVTLGDAQAAALGEFHHPLGCLSPAEAGIVVHLSSGLCVGVWDQRLSVTPLPARAGEVPLDEPRRKRRLCKLLNGYSVIGAVGRWLCIDPLTSCLYLATRDGAEPVDEASTFWSRPLLDLRRRVFKGEPHSTPWPSPVHPRDKSTPGNDVIRLSAWLSADAVALRCFLKVFGPSGRVPAAPRATTWHDDLTVLARQYKEALEQTAAQERKDKSRPGAVERYAQIYRELVARIPQRAIFDALLEATANDPALLDRYEQVIADVARELAMVIRCLRRVLAHAAPTLDYSRTVIVTDAPIWHFGLSARTDSLLEQLRSTMGEKQILRSRIGSGAARAAAGFAGYLYGRAPL